jgi:hypothetical protein
VVSSGFARIALLPWSFTKAYKWFVEAAFFGRRCETNMVPTRYIDDLVLEHTGTE